ncbi:alpha-1,2-mannosidase family protein-like protein [Coleophoma crateriformis]|uniref:Alpha-1,2-mannosidase family protein-like protein n=1 Tax=Coleophoma crateriformis TaxID=565419 RepID=A0A3D8SN78_9HELO|nr:alpha-1,2-mannosidase family protein-like protein [Coleophoma crateriformis]
MPSFPLMKTQRSWLSLLAWATLTSAASLRDFTKYVNLFIGTEGPVVGSAYNSGNVFPGASLPFGAVKVGIDTTRWDTSFAANGGYTPDGNVTAITMLHESGTGGAPTYGIVPQMPLTSLEGVNLMDNLTYMQPRTTRDTASVGYYKTSLANGIVAEMSATHHAGLIRYQFPENTGRYVVVDISHFLPSKGKKEQWYSNGMIETSEDGSWYSGYGVWRQGWSGGGDYRVYFCSQYDTAPDNVQLFSGPYTDPFWPNATNAKATFTNVSSIVGGTVGYQYADRIGALFSFPKNTSTVTSKIGISWISAHKACQFLEEVPHWDLNTSISSAVDTWNSEVFSKIDVQSGNETLLEMFYTALYHAHLLPSDRTGENPNWESDEPYYDDFYTIWDTFRCLSSLLTLILPERQTGIVRALIDIWRHERFMPDGRSHNNNGRVQGGSNSDNVLADAYIKGLRDGINWTDGYAAMKTNAEVLPYNNYDPEDLTGSTKEGRGALPDWHQYGYLTPDFGRSLSKTVDYSLNDFALSQVARVESPQDIALYLNRSAGWQKIWHANITSLNFTGFLAPTWANGSVMAGYDPLSCGLCEWDSISYEGVPWEYSFSIPHDMQTLITLMGGANTTEARLDTMFTPQLSASNVGGNSIGSTIFNPGNEPSFMTPFLYNYLGGRQWKSVLRTRQIIDQYYGNSRSGLPGNDDAGALSSWLIWSMLGLYPVVTQPVYLLVAPWFDDISMQIKTGTVQITADRPTAGGVYVQSVVVNGVPWNQSWISHDALIGNGGARIHFVLGEKKAEWDFGALPPSPGHLR